MKEIKVLDHGFVRLHNVSGPTRRPDKTFDADDVDPANSARMSFGQMNSDRTREQELKLCNYLIENRHNTPIEMVECWIEMKLPIFVARQFVRHRTACINEISGRYVKLPKEWYIPNVVGGQAKDKKQGQENNLPEHSQKWFKNELDTQCSRSYDKYSMAIKQGVAAEHARMFLHLNHYTHWLWKQDLHNIMHFLALREHNHAQIEANVYATAIIDLLKGALPDIMELYEKHRRIS